MNSCFVCTEDCSGRAAEDGAEKDAAIALHQALIHAPGNAALTHCVCCRCFDDETGTVGTNDLLTLDRYALVSTGRRADDHRSARDKNGSTLDADKIAMDQNDRAEGRERAEPNVRI